MSQVSSTKPRLTTSAMIASLAAEGQRTKPAPFGHALAEVAQTNPKVVGLTADLGKYTDLHVFAQAHPKRFFQMGTAEQLLLGAASGMAREGFVPFATTYAVFASRRAYDFICLDIAEEGLNVKVIGALPGLTTGYGPSHQATEDVAIFRAMPNLTIVDPCDALDIEQAVPAIAEYPGPVYMRLLRGNVPLVLDEYDYRFELGKAKLLRDGGDALIVASGFMTMRALAAAEQLRSDKLEVAVLHVATIKPLDVETIARECSRAGRPVIVAENHSSTGGLGEAVDASALGNISDGVPADRPPGCVSRRRRAADAARSLRYLNRRYGEESEGMVVTLQADTKIQGAGMLLKDKTAVITGAASERGLGKATAKLFAEHGARVAIFDLNEEASQQAAGTLPAVDQGAHIGLACNVADKAQCEEAVAKALQSFGKIDILVNNAGITQPLKFMEIQPNNYDAVMDVSLRGTLYMSQAVVPGMRERHGGSIVNLSSVSAQRGGGIFGGPHYSAAKAGVLGLTKAMAREFGPDGIRVNAICPGLILTDITAGKLTDAMLKSIVDAVPMGRAGVATDVAGCCLFLASDLSAYVTGSEVDVNGGSHIH